MTIDPFFRKTHIWFDHFAESHNRCTVTFGHDDRCDKPAVHAIPPIVEWHSWYFECAEHKKCHPSCRCHPRVTKAAAYTVESTPGGRHTIRIEATGEVVKTQSTANYILIKDGKVKATAWVKKTRDLWNMGGEYSGTIIDMR